MELSCDGLLNRYLVVTLQNAVFGAEFLSICKAVSWRLSRPMKFYYLIVLSVARKVMNFVENCKYINLQHLSISGMQGCKRANEAKVPRPWLE